jgi:hypothetical protein
MSGRKNGSPLLQYVIWPLAVTLVGGTILLFLEYRTNFFFAQDEVSRSLTQTPRPTSVPRASTATPTPPTSSATPTLTQVPTNTPVPPTSTPVLPTDTPMPPLNTPITELTNVPISSPTQKLANTLSSPSPSCLTPAFFQDIWQGRPQLGCPINSLTSDFTFQTFQGGILAWQKSPNPSIIYAFFYNGRWERQVDPGGPPKPSCPEAEQTSGLGPILSFGTLWCENADWREQLGTPTSGEIDGKNNQIQNFENGTVLTIGAAGGFILYSDSHWEQF